MSGRSGGSLVVGVREDSGVASPLRMFGPGLGRGGIRRERRSPRPAGVWKATLATGIFDFFTLGMTCYFTLLRYTDQSSTL